MYECNLCFKNYKHKQSLYKHKKKCNFNQYESKIDQCSINVAKCSKNVASGKSKCSINVAFSEQNSSSNKCKYCQKEFKHSSSRYRHEKKCKETYDVEMLSKEVMDQKINEIKNEMLSFMNKKYKMHHNTFKKLKRQLKINNNYTTNNNTTNNINNTQNNLNIQQNINIIPLGKENFVNNLDKETQIAVVKKHFGCIKYLCDITHFNPKTPQYQSFVITNTQNNIAYIYDEKSKDYVPITKKELLHNIFHERGSDVREFIECNEQEIKTSLIDIAVKFIDRLDTEPTFLKEKGNEFKVYIYNKTKDIDINKFKMLEI